MPDPWFENVWRRNVIDMHIPDWDGAFLSEIDPEVYAETLARSQAQSTVLYANSCVGLCLYPTAVGQAHAAARARNVTAELIDACHRRGIKVVLYYSLVFDNWAWEHDPDWRIIGPDGSEAMPPHKGPIKPRFKICCPNSGYRDYVAALTRELCTTFDTEGIRFDMAFWPCVCYCRHCRARFEAEVGGHMPRRIDWSDPTWVRFQRARERWLVEFATVATEAARAVKPQLSVEHQASTFIQSWRSGVSADFTTAQDFLQGDFYGDKWQGSFARKLFSSLSRNLPFGFETSFCVDITNHTAKKSAALLHAKAAGSLADGGAFVFIDGIDPQGTLNPAVYDTMGAIFEKTKPYERFLGGRRVQDIAIYFSTESKHNPADNGKPVDDPSLPGRLPHVESTLAAYQVLVQEHLPVGVITRLNLDRLGEFRAVILANVLMMSPAEVAALRHYAQHGGRVLATHATSLQTSDGQRPGDFMLADVLGVSYLGQTDEPFTYIAPAPGSEPLFGGYTVRHPLGFESPQVLVRPAEGATVLGQAVRPYTHPYDRTRFAAQHSNPPGPPTGTPGVVHHAFGRGQSLYIAGDLHSATIHGAFLANLVRKLCPEVTWSAVAPAAVEITCFHQPARRRFLFALVNFQQELPNIPVEGIELQLRLDQRQLRRVCLLPGEAALAHEAAGDVVTWTAPRLETLMMMAVDYA